MIQHYPTCSPKYPEKPKGEAPQHIVEIALGDGEIARVCSDCGASEVVKKEDR